MHIIQKLAGHFARIISALLVSAVTISGTSSLGLYSAAGVAVTASAVFSTPANAKPNGRTVTVIQFQGGSFELNQRGEWLEFGSGSNAVRYTFRETHRDGWSVYGHDASRNMRIQMDLHRMKILLQWPGHPMQDQYSISSASDRLNGRNPSYVAMDGGSFTQNGNCKSKGYNSS